MSTRYAHTNIVARDWKALADFYVEVFGCEPVPPERDLSGDWLDRLTGLEDASIRGVHLLLPGYGEDGPTLEIFQYGSNREKGEPAADREGFTHIAFEVDDVEAALDKLVSAGGGSLGELVRRDYGDRVLTVVYATDPEGNIIELQRWEPGETRKDP